MSQTGIVILARYDSRRLPGKALLPIGDRPLLGRVLDRVKRVPDSGPIVVATSDRALDDPIAALAADAGVAVFRGSASDVLGRVLACAEDHDLARVIRISGDSPFIDPDLCGRLKADAANTNTDLVTNVSPRTYPAGMSVEAIARTALARAAAAASEPADREHVTTFLYRNPDMFSIHNVRAETDNSDVTLTVDTARDLARARWIVATLGEQTAATADADTVIALARRWEADNPASGKSETHD